MAECAASLVRELESEATQNATNASKINARATPRSGRSRLAMYCLGELARLPPSAGRASALGDAGVAASFETLARDAFETRSEKKSGKESHAQTHAKHGDESFVTPAAFALGGACAGLECRARFLPFVVAGVADAADARAEYAFLVATREAIFSASRDDIADGFLAVTSTDSRTDDAQPAQTKSSSSFFTRSETSSLVEALLAAAERTKEEGARAVIAECLGRLASRETFNVDDDDAAENENAKEGLGLMARLRADVCDARLGPGRRATAMAAAKHAVLHGETRGLRTALIYDALPGFVNFETLGAATDATTRLAATRCLSAVAHAEPAAVASRRATSWIGAIAPALFAQTPVDKTLVRVVDLGPFKHTVDDGLETRKAAFECLATLLDAFRVAANAKAADAEETGDFLDAAPPGFANGVATAASLGAGDHYDVKIVAHALICALVKSRLGLEAARGVLPETCAAFKATLTAKLKSDAVKQEQDRAADLARSCLRAVAALRAKLGEGHAERHPEFAAFVDEVVMTEKHAKAFEDARAAAAEEDGVAA